MILPTSGFCPNHEGHEEGEILLLNVPYPFAYRSVLRGSLIRPARECPCAMSRMGKVFPHLRGGRAHGRAHRVMDETSIGTTDAIDLSKSAWDKERLDNSEQAI
jgi:hypothetical protein